MQKLVYKRYRGCNDILTIDLHNGYTVIAIKIWDKDQKFYTVELRIKENTIEKWDLIDDANSLCFRTNFKFIDSVILNKVSKLLEDGFFDYYIKLYEYETKCFDVGNEINELMREERIKNINAQ